ncbi:MarR family winged helix-turn-helix transcriptional regulator [Streptomyces phytophilus]|uniref:MarR family winged helix-turn-helix transcriptional regulator n=1 Tax=Streptomyces phytophilus TaxID=722715 RepID=UPI0035A99739
MHKAETPGGGQVDVGNGVDHVFLDLERELAVFYRRARGIAADMARQVDPGLEPGAYAMLAQLEAGGRRATELAGYFNIGKATVSRQLHALEELGLVDREPDPADGRAALVRLTDEGRRRMLRVRGARHAEYIQQLAGWDLREVGELARLLGRFNELSAGGGGRRQT